MAAGWSGAPKPPPPRPQALTATTSQPCQGVPGAGARRVLGPCAPGTFSRFRPGAAAGSVASSAPTKGDGHAQEGPGARRQLRGLTAALSVKHELQGDVDVTVVSASDRFLFNPSLIWLPFGKRRPQDITFPLAPTFESHQVDFVHASATRIDPLVQQVQTTYGGYGYDYLVIATGYRNQVDVIPGLDLANAAYMITTLQDAIHAGEGWQQFLADPGP